MVLVVWVPCEAGPKLMVEAKGDGALKTKRCRMFWWIGRPINENSEPDEMGFRTPLRAFPRTSLSGGKAQDPLTHSQQGYWMGGIRTGWLREMMDREGSKLIGRSEADTFGVIRSGPM